mmetsp:Transcript_113639/g.178812  ORF Transcript_113639/g.178812 Transcript_113639/m.178812 type:complete len:219 (+) Transcript_113639:1418-2074(+)
MMIDLTPNSAILSKINLLPWRPAETNTTVAPSTSLRRRFCASSVALSSRLLGSFANIAFVAVGINCRMTASRSSRERGFGRLPGDEKSCSTSNFDLCPFTAAEKSERVLRSLSPMVVLSFAPSSITMSKSITSSRSRYVRGAGEANAFGDFGEEKLPELGRCIRIASSKFLTLSSTYLSGLLSGSMNFLGPAKQPPQHLEKRAMSRKSMSLAMSKATL